MKLRDLLLIASGVAAASQASALSLGNSQGRIHLGAPVDLVFKVQPDPGQTADSSCIAAGVWMGDTALRSSQIKVTTTSTSVRVQTTTPVYEPLITIKLHAGCSGSVSRSYTFFADPPSTLAASVQPIDLEKIQVGALPVVSRTAVEPVSVKKKPRRAKRAVAVKRAAPTASAAASPPVIAPQAPPAAVAASSQPESMRPSSNAAPTTEATASAAAIAGHDRPRLRIEPIEGLDIPEATTETVDKADPQRTAAQDPALLPSAAIDPNTQLVLKANAARLEAMEKQFQALQTQLVNNRTEIVSLQNQLAQAQNQALPLWVYLVLVMLAAALATIAWLLQRMKQERQTAQRAWADTVLAVDDSQQAISIDPHDTPAASLHTPATAPAAAMDVASAPETVPPSSSKAKEDSWSSVDTYLPTQFAEDLYAEFEELETHTPAPPAATAAKSAMDVLTAQALFDVQEQAEFYASIGENDQAIEILQAHIAEHEASSPLAYIELLQLLYRLSRTDKFEQVRQKFQTHFNVQVPDFLGFSRKGHDIWSGYPEVLGQIEALWPTDDVQVLLLSLIVRNPANHSQRFDLSAFDDLLMLYNVAQTTPASSRGELPGRKRTTPAEVPLPELVFAAEAPMASALPYQTRHDASTEQLDATTATAPEARSPTLEAKPLAMQDAHLELLSATPAQAPLQPLPRISDSPFSNSTRFAPDELLMDGLSLEYADEPSTKIPVSTTPAVVPSPATMDPSSATYDLDAELAEFMLSETAAEKKIENSEIDELNPELAEFIMDERDLPTTRNI
ncbi:hypothetical protein [Comamonas sp. NoAH]|uniref:hypothetical protein n=1 Tax=Comamonas halotolerans TaxID=3041496 RepID=UPI0024E09F7D|nr:hypothetical protein [Comamonas sp. NoAH]